MRAQNQPTVTGYAFVREELWLVGLALAAGLLAALVPAWRAYRRDVAVTLAQVA